MKTTKLLITLFCLIAGQTFAQKLSKNYYLFIGTYTKKTSEGIYVYKFNAKTGKLDSVGVAKGVKNPSFLTISPDQKFVYSVGETDGEGSVNAFSFDKKSGKLTFLNTQSSGGANPCYVTIDKTNHWVLVGNYTGGSLSILPIEKDGLLGKATQTIQHEGKGIIPDRQEKAHVHSVNISPNNKDIFVPDLGIDKIVTYQLDAKNGKLLAGNPAFTKMKDGAGPRHFAIHPNGKFAYIIQELNNTITAFNYSKSKLRPFQTVSTLAKGFKFEAQNRPADIHISPDGKFLYGSNRYVDATKEANRMFSPDLFTDTIVIYAIDAKTGKLKYVGNEPVAGKVPRNFAIDPTGNFLLVANQESDNVTIFKRNKTTGKLTFTGKEIHISMPVCLKLLATE